MGVSERDLESGRVDKDQEQEALSQLQSEIVKKNTERQGLLSEEKAAEMAAGQRMGLMKQAAGVVSGFMAQPNITPNESAGISPATAGLLNKYGYGNKPGTSRNQKVVQGPQAVTVNNVTTNNVSVPPQASQPIRMSQPSGDNGASKLKAWLSNSFQQQEAETQRREQSYSRKERSLSRSTSKMMRSLEKIGKSVASTLDPSKISHAIGDQFGIMMKLFWFTFLANNWEKIINGITGIANWVQGVWQYFTGGQEGEKSGFVKDMITVFGGDPETETAFESLQKLLIDEKEGLYGYIKLMMDNFFEERREALKQVKKPDFSNMSILDPMQALGAGLGYIGDLLSAGIGGISGLQSAVDRQITEQERIESTQLGRDEQLQNFGSSATDSNGKVYKAGSLATGNFNAFGSTDAKGAASMLSSDYDISGDLNTKDQLASVRLSRSILSNMKTGNGAGVMTGLNTLDEATRKSREGLLVRADFIDTLSKTLPPDELRKLNASGGVQTEKWKVVVGNNDLKDSEYENTSLLGAAQKAYAGSWVGAGGVILGNAIGFGSGNSAVIERYGPEKAKQASKAIGDAKYKIYPTVGINHSVGKGIANAGLSYAESSISEAGREMHRNIAARKSNQQALTVVPLSDPRPAVRTSGTNPDGTVTMYRISNAFIRALQRALNAKDFKSSRGDDTKRVEGLLMKTVGRNKWNSADTKYSDKLEGVRSVQAIVDAGKEREKEYWESSRMKKAEAGAKEVGSKAINFAKGTFKGAKEWTTNLYKGHGKNGNAHALTTRSRSVSNTSSNGIAIGNNVAGTGSGFDKRGMSKSDDEDDEDDDLKKKRKKRPTDPDELDSTASIDSQRANMSSSGGSNGNTSSYSSGNDGSFADGDEYGPNAGTDGVGKPLNGAGIQTRMNQAYSYLAGANTGLPLQAIAGIVGNIAHENLAGYHRGQVYWDNNGISAGIAGFHEQGGKGELAEYMKYYYGISELPKGWQLKSSPWRAKIVEATKDLNKQLGFIMHRIKTTYSGLYNKLSHAKSAREASILFSQGYERFAGYKGDTAKGRAELANRAADAEMVYSGKYTRINARTSQPVDSTKATRLQTVVYNGKKYMVGADYDSKKETPEQYYKRKSQEGVKAPSQTKSTTTPVKAKPVEKKEESWASKTWKTVKGWFGSDNKKEEQKQQTTQQAPTKQEAPKQQGQNQNQQGQQTQQQSTEDSSTQATIDSSNANMADSSSEGGGSSAWINSYDPGGYISPFQALSAVRKPKIDYSRLVKPRKKTDPLFSQMNQLILEVRGFTEATMNNTASTVESLNYTNMAIGSIYKKIGGTIQEDPITPTESLTT